jgi:DNA-binding GntR family transcriptional regulator
MQLNSIHRSRTSLSTRSVGTPTTDVVERSSLSERAYKQLEEMVVTLQLQPGAVVTEGELGARLGIGRTPLREAIQRLAIQRLVTTLPRRGLVVSEINLTDHLGVLETRRVLDRLLAAGAARRATPEERTHLKEYAAWMSEAAQADNLAEFMRLDQEFDQLLAAAAHNHAASNAIAPLHIHCRRFWYFYRHQGDLPRAAAHHSALIDAVAEGDEERATEASDILMQYLEDFTRKALDLYLNREKL